MKRVLLTPAFVLHRRSYRETSYLVELLTQEYGRLTVVARGVRKVSSPANGLLQPFIPLLVSFSGQGELKTLSQVEVNGKITALCGDCLFAGFYLNELLMNVLHQWDACPFIYDIYHHALLGLSSNTLEQKVLRSFEKRLLKELGYEILPQNNTILHDKYYRFVPGEGFILNGLSEAGEASQLFFGQHLLAIANENWENKACLPDAKRLTRLVFKSILGEKILHSRRLFTHLNEAE